MNDPSHQQEDPHLQHRQPQRLPHPLHPHSTICLCLRYRLATGVVFHVVAIISCLELHFTWKCVRDWSAVQNFLDGQWTKSEATLDAKLGDLAKRIRHGADDATLFYLLGMVPLV